MNKIIEIVDRGRGPQLSTSRITVQDLLPYFQQQWSHEQILEVMPVLSEDELLVVERFVQDHYEEIMEQDRRIRERNAGRKNPPEIEEILRRGGERMAALREQFKNRQFRQERSGDSGRR
jgi:uncharacterized protein (DUF433 family)